MKKINGEEITLDYFYKNRVKVLQKKNGYRFSVDSPILADFIPDLNGNILEIGTGSGIISFLLLYSGKAKNIKAVEIQKDLCTLAKESSEHNGFADNFELFCGDFNEIYNNFSETDTIFTNPPYLKTGSGKLSTNIEIRTAKFETDLTLEKLLRSSKNILSERGDIFLILPFFRFEELIDLAKHHVGLYVNKVRKIFSFSYRKPERFLVQLSNYRGNFEELTSLVIYDSPGIYTKEMDSVLAGIKYDK